MRRLGNIVLVVAGLIFLVLASLQSLRAADEREAPADVEDLITTPQAASVIKAPTPDINRLPLQDNLALYQADDPGSVVVMYVTVRRGNAADNTDYTWEEVNELTKFFFADMQNVDVGRVDAIVQIGDESGPLPAQGALCEVLTDAIIQIRGNSASLRPQRSYKIELRGRAGDWRGQRTILLNKHGSDISRMRNKLSFDLMQGIPNLVTLRTQFVHLYVKDETSDPPSDAFVDYGLFTQIEQPN